ncbi:MAG: hypothetical protein EPO32_02260 [Anaerolineae bacterium]|nr:MAG: hypothetical protein EPO32_02260 [Anaerolineae bacterium]
MDWYENTLHHQFTASLAHLRRVKKPLHQRIKERALDVVMLVFIPLAERVRQHQGLVSLLQGLGEGFMSQPRAFRWMLVGFFGWCAGLGMGAVVGFLIP